MSDDDSPRLFRRERNLSNRNFARSGSRRRISNKTNRCSVETSSGDTTTTTNSSTECSTEMHHHNNSNSNSNIDETSSSISSSLQISYSINSESESAFNKKSLLKMAPAVTADSDANSSSSNYIERSPTAEQPPPITPDPAMMDVKQKVLRFETLRAEERIIFKTGKFKSKSFEISAETDTMNNKNKHNKIATASSSSSTINYHRFGPLRVLPTFLRANSSTTKPSTKPIDDVDSSNTNATSTSGSFMPNVSIDEERSEDDVADISNDDDVGDDDAVARAADVGEAYVVPEAACEIKEDLVLTPTTPTSQEFNANAKEFGIDDFGKVETVRPAALNSTVHQIQNSKKTATDFPRNYRTIPRRKTDITHAKNRHLVEKFHSVYQPKDNDDEVEVEEDEIELRNKSEKFINPILEELIKTEESYVENLIVGLKNYGNIFQRKDLPIGLRGKKYVLLGNIEHILEFHRDHFLPMLLRTRRDLKRLFDEFQRFIDQNDFYGYVIFTMNKQKSLKLCEVYKTYFKLIQLELDDKLGINSFLVQPIQRMARYPLLLQQFITTLFKHRDCVEKAQIESCCRLEKKMRTLLTTTNESEIINDIIDCNEFNVFYQGKFRKVSDFNVFDHTLKRHYHAKVFIFDKCIIYTEIKGKNLVFHGRYPCEHIGIQSKVKSFTLYYERRKQQECDFSADPMQIEMWLELIREMVQSYAAEERQKLQELYAHDQDHQHRKPPSLSLFRDSNRFSSDSGIGNIWVMPKPEAEEVVGNRTTWYAIT